MVSRRAALKDSHEKLPRLIEEVGMRHYIAVCYMLVINSVLLIKICLEPEVSYSNSFINPNRRLLLPRPS